MSSAQLVSKVSGCCPGCSAVRVGWFCTAVSRMLFENLRTLCSVVLQILGIPLQSESATSERVLHSSVQNDVQNVVCSAVRSGRFWTKCPECCLKIVNDSVQRLSIGSEWLSQMYGPGVRPTDDAAFEAGGGR